jgi:hypothetical protein
MRRWRAERDGRRLGAAALLIAAGLTVSAAGIEPPATEARVKAAFVFNFARYVDWPESAFADERSPYVVGIYGRSDLTDAIEAALRDKQVHTRSVTVRRFSRAEPVGQPLQLLVVARGEPGDLRTLASSTPGAPVLTVGDSEGFCQRGGAINFFLEDGRVRFEMNLDVIESLGLHVSSSLLRLARLVREPPPAAAPPTPGR